MALPAGLADLLKTGYAESHSTLRLTVDDADAPVAQDYRLATGAVDTPDGAFAAGLVNVGEIKSALDASTDTAEANLDDVACRWTPLLINRIESLQGAQAIIGRYWRDLNSGQKYHAKLMTGVVTGARSNDLTMGLSIISDVYAARSVGANKPIRKKCGLEFKGAACGYTGGLTTCNKLLNDADGCSGRSNTFRFGGEDALDPAQTVTANGALKAPANYTRVINEAGTTLTMRKALKVIGGTLADNATTKVTELDLTGAGSLGWFFVDSYGAVGDGTTNDTTAIQAAIDAAEAVKGTVFFGRKVYKVTGLTVEGKVRLVGSAEGGSVIYSNSNAVIVDMSADGDFLGGTLENLTVRGEVAAGSSQIGVKVDDATYGYRFAVRNVLIENCGDHGLYVKRAFSSTFENIFVTNCADYPFLYDGANMPGNYFLECYAGDLRSGAEIAFRVLSGTMNLYSCNGVNGGAGLTKSIWAEVGTATTGARLEVVDCNIESFGLRGIRARHGSTVSVLGNTTFAAHGVSDAVTITIASPGVVTWNNHPFVNGDSLAFATTGALPTGLVAGTRYYVVNKTTNTFQVSATRGGAAINTSGSQSGVHTLTKYAKAIEYTLENDGVDYFAPYLTRGYLDDTVDFADGAAAYADGYPVHANGFLPLQLRGQGAMQGGSPNAKLTSFFNTATSTAMLAAREDGNVAVDVVTATKSYAHPGVRYIELNHSAPITITLPWPGWYARAQEPIYIKDRSTAGCATNNVTVQSNGGGTIHGTSSLAMNINKQGLLLLPDGAGDWRVISSWPEYKLISEAGSNVAIAGTLSAQDVYVEAYSASASTAPGYYRRRHRGSVGSPAAVQNGDSLAYEVYEGQRSTTVGQRHAGAYVTVTATENWDATHAGTKYVISVAPNGSTDGFAKKWEFDGDNGLKRPGGAYLGDLQAARVYRGSTQSVNNITWTPITFDNETRDDGGFHSTSSNLDRMTAPATGWYQISANIEFVANNTGSRMVRFFLNGTTEIARAALASIATYSTFVPLTATYYLTAGDYVTCDVFQDSGGSLNVGTGGFYQIHRVY